MTNTTKKRFISGLRGAVPLAVSIALAAVLVAVLVVKYQQDAAEQAAKLAEFCAAPATGNFSLKLACVNREAQSRITP